MDQVSQLRDRLSQADSPTDHSLKKAIVCVLIFAAIAAVVTQKQPATPVQSEDPLFQPL